MEDVIEICSGCGKMPRSIDNANGYFMCSRCGNKSTITVETKDYEKIATELDQKFHNQIIKSKIETASKEPIAEPSPKAAKKSSSKKVQKSKKKASKGKK